MRCWSGTPSMRSTGSSSEVFNSKHKEGRAMADFGVVTTSTHYTMQPAELGRWAEAHGFESLWFGEHTYIPTSRKTPFPMGGELPVYYKEFFDPFIGLSAAAAVTEKL